MTINIKASNAIIEKSLKTLQESERGQKTIKDLKVFLNSNQQGLDSEAAGATAKLVYQFFVNHRRFF